MYALIAGEIGGMLVLIAGFLDGQYTAFGKATAGLDVIDKIVNLPRDRNDRPNNPAKINKITIAEK